MYTEGFWWGQLQWGFRGKGAKTLKKTTITLLLCIMAGVCGGSTAEPQTKYFALFMDGLKAGYSSHSRTVSQDRVITTEMVNLDVQRVGIPISIVTFETHIETPDGRALEFKSVQDLGLMRMEIVGRSIGQGRFEVTAESGGQEQKQIIEIPEGTLMSEGIRLLQLEKGLKEGTNYTAKIFSGGMLTAIDVDIVVGPTENVDLLGRVARLTRIDTAMRLMTGEVASTSYVDKEVRLFKSVIPIAGLKVEMVSCTKAFALSDNDIIDLLDKTLVRSPVVLGDISKARTITYKLAGKGDAKFHIPSNDNQKVVVDGNGLQIVTVRPVKAPDGVKLGYKGSEPELLEALKPTRFVQSDSKEIIALAKEAIGQAQDAGEAARRIEKFVNNYIEEKSFGIGYGSAVEVAQSREGDCSEHAVLTAAMCRAAGIPAQVVSGMVYIDDIKGYRNIFGGHAWTQAYIGDRWMYLDATRPDRSKAGHIALASGSGDPESFLEMVTSIGNFVINEVEIKN
jgi:hypothetical protein